jgi:hypothetical protein
VDTGRNSQEGGEITMPGVILIIDYGRIDHLDGVRADIESTFGEANVKEQYDINDDSVTFRVDAVMEVQDGDPV